MGLFTQDLWNFPEQLNHAAEPTEQGHARWRVKRIVRIITSGVVSLISDSHHTRTLNFAPRLFGAPLRQLPPQFARCSSPPREQNSTEETAR